MPLITAIVSASLSIGTVPSQFKQVVIMPLLKKSAFQTSVQLAVCFKSS